MPDALAAAYDVLLLDLDGVVYIGGTAIPGAPEALQQASERRRARLAYVTNNASRTPAAVAAMLTGMGVPAKAADVVTSAQAAARLLAEKLPPKAKVLVLGALALRLAVRERGLIPVSNAAENPQAVVQGYSPGLGYGSLAEGGLAVRAGALFVGTNADSTIPSARGTAPGNGSLLQVIEHATGVQAADRGQAGAAAAPRVGHPHRRQAAAGDRRPPRHRHRGRLQRRRRQPAGAHRRRQPPQRRARPAAPPPDLHRREPRRPAPALPGRRPHRRRRDLRRLDRHRPDGRQRQPDPRPATATRSTACAPSPPPPGPSTTGRAPSTPSRSPTPSTS